MIGLFVARLLRPARFAVPLAAAAAVIVLGIVAGASERDGLTLAALLVDEIVLVLAAPLGGLAVGVATLGSWVDDGTLPYLRLQPLSRWRLAASAWLAALGVAVPIAVASALAGALATGAGLTVGLGAAVATAVAAVAFTSASVALGLRSRSAAAWGLGYVLLWEAFVSEAGPAAAALSVRQAALSIGSAVAGFDLAPELVSPGAAATLVAAIVVLSVWVTKRGLDRG